MVNSNLEPTQQVLVIFGAGRSGTSLTMQLLLGMGMKVSRNLITANASNPEGFYEDSDIRDAHVQLMDELMVHPAIPLVDDWLDTTHARKQLQFIEQLVKNKLDEANGTWGVKDPLLSGFLPIWFKVFNRLRVVPKYIFALRDPAAVVSSFVHQYGYQSSLAELVLLNRMVGALQSTAADCFVAHYEDWFDDPQPLARALLHYTRLDLTFKGNLSDVLASTVKPYLNRASHDPYEIQNPYVLKLYTALKECHGADFDRDRLMSVVKECRQAMEGFKGWYQLAHQAHMKLADVQKRLEKVSAEADKVKILEAQIRLLESEKKQNAQWAQQVQKLERQLDQLLSVNLGKS